MAVRWPDGSFTGSVLATPAPARVEPKPEESKSEPEKQPEDKKKETVDGNR